jgi:superkiller protein 3
MNIQIIKYKEEKMKKFLLVIMILLSVNLFAKTKTFIREYTYNASEYDSKVTSRANALAQVKELLLSEIGVFVRSQNKISTKEIDGKIKEMTSSDISVLTAGIVETKIVEEKWDGKTFYIKAKMVADPDNVNKKLSKIINNEQKKKELQESIKREKDALAELKKIRDELKNVKNENEKLKKQKQYNKQSKILTAEEYFQKGNIASENEEYNEAIFYYQKSIEINPQSNEAYYNMGFAYQNKGNYNRAIECYEKSIEINPQYDDAYTNMGLAYVKKGNDNKAIECWQIAARMGNENAQKNLNIINGH